MSGIAAGHCRGFWCALGELDTLGADALPDPAEAAVAGAVPRGAGRVADEPRANCMPELEAQFETVAVAGAGGRGARDAWAGGRGGARIHRAERLARARAGETQRRHGRSIVW